MDFPIKMVIFHSYVKLPEGSGVFWWGCDGAFAWLNFPNSPRIWDIKKKTPKCVTPAMLWEYPEVAEGKYLQLKPLYLRLNVGFPLDFSSWFRPCLDNLWSFIGSDMKGWENRCDFLMFEIVGPPAKDKGHGGWPLAKWNISMFDP